MKFSDLHLSWSECKYKNKRYRTYYLAQAFREDGKNKKRNIHKLGKLTDEEALEIKQLLKVLKTPNTFTTSLDNIVVQSRYGYLDVATALEIWNYWKLNEAFCANDEKLIETSTIASILTVNRSIDPSEESEIQDWFRSTSLPLLLETDVNLMNTKGIFREVKTTDSIKEIIFEHLFKRYSEEDPKSMNSDSIDLPSMSFSDIRCILVKCGKLQVGYDYNAVLALFVNKNGLPLYWEVLSGSTIDVNAIKCLFDRVGQKLKDITLVFDRGMVSKSNIIFLEKQGIKYITEVDKNQTEEIAKVDFESFDLNSNIHDKIEELNFSKLDEDTYYKEVKLESKHRYILCFNPQIFLCKRKNINKVIEGFKEFVHEMNRDLLMSEKSLEEGDIYSKFNEQLMKHKIKPFVDIDLVEMYVDKVRTYQGKIIFNKIDYKHSKGLGFCLLVTNHQEQVKDEFIKSQKELINSYGDRVAVKSSFSNIKSCIEAITTSFWSIEHVKAYYTICVLAYLINRTIDLRLQGDEGTDLTKHVVNHQVLYNILSDCKVDNILVKNVNQSTYKMSKISEEQKELLGRIGLSHLANETFLKRLMLG